MTAPNKMAKRAAAGTLALAICFTGGVLGAGAANAVVAANSATITATSDNNPVVRGAAPTDLGTLTVTLPAAVTFADQDSFTLTAPTGFTFSGAPTAAPTFSGTPVGSATLAGTIATGGKSVTFKFTGSSDGNQAEAYAITGLNGAANGDATAGQASATVTNLPGVTSVGIAMIQSTSGIETATTLPVIPVGTTGAASDVTIKDTNITWDANDTLRFTLPADEYFASAPKVTISNTTDRASTTTRLRPVTARQLNGDNSVNANKVVAYDLIFVDAIGTGSDTNNQQAVTSTDITLALTGLSIEIDDNATNTTTGDVNLAIARGTATGTDTAPTFTDGTANANFFPTLAANVKIADATSVSVVQTGTQNLITDGGPQMISPIRVAEVAGANAGLKDGNYTLTFSHATVSDPNASGFKATVTGSPRLNTPTITQNTANSVTIGITGTNDQANDYFDVSNLYISPTGGNVDVTITTDSGAVLPTGKVATIAVTATAERIGGLDRYATASQIATALKGTDLNTTDGQQPTVVNDIILAQGGFQTPGEQAPDALTANYLSGQKTVAGTGAVPASFTGPDGTPTADEFAQLVTATSQVAPILLTDRDSLPSYTLQAMTAAFGITDTGTNAYADKTITVVGGPQAVSEAVIDKMRAVLPGVKVVRVEGADRYATAAAVVLGQSNNVVRYSPTFNTAKVPTAVIASGENSADALSAGPITAKVNLPLLLTEKGNLPDTTKAALSAKGIGRVILMGGTDAVSQNVEDQLKALNITVERFAGTDRFDTSAQFLTWAKTAAATTTTPTGGGLGLSSFNSDTVYLTNGDKFADALVDGPLSAATNRNVVLTTATALPTPSSVFIQKSDASAVVAIGLEQVVPTAVVDAAKKVANGSMS